MFAGNVTLDKVEQLDAGADDYLPKSNDLRELFAKVSRLGGVFGLASADEFRLQFSLTNDSMSDSGAAIMGRFGSFLLGFVLGGAAAYGGLKYHVVYAKDGVHFVPKIYATFDETFVDIRDFGVSDWSEHKSLAAALVKADKANLLEGAAANELRDSVDDLLKGFTDGSP